MTDAPLPPDDLCDLPPARRKPTRIEPRVAADCAARLVWADLTDSRLARLRDISRLGARIRLEQAVNGTLPRQLYLLVHLPQPQAPRLFAAMLRWQIEDRAGLQFDQPLDPEIFEFIASRSAEVSG
jgi:hypothetical protein